jgi:hypothetical protein
MEEDALPCHSKMAFGTKKEAQTAATVAMFQHGTKLTVYRCKYCDLWHLASA